MQTRSLEIGVGLFLLAGLLALLLLALRVSGLSLGAAQDTYASMPTSTTPPASARGPR